METLVTWGAAIVLLVFVAIGICSMFMNSADPQNDVNAPNLSGLKCFGNRPCFGCLPNGELVKVGGYPDTVSLSAEETERMALSLPCTERNVETESVRCTDSGSLEARIVYIGKERTLLICHDGNGKEKDFYALADNQAVRQPTGGVVRVEKGPKVKIREFVIGKPASRK